MEYISCKHYLENGKTAYIDFLEDGEAAWGSTEFLVLRAKPGISCPQFVYYLATSPKVRTIAIKSMSGTSGRQRVQQDMLENLEVRVPSLPTQRRVAAVLSALDAKIEVNARISANLEAQARAVFRARFVNISSVPQGWRKGCLLDIADYLNGLAMQKFRPKEGDAGLPVLKIKELRQGFCDAGSELCSSSISPEYIVEDGDVIFAWSASLLVDIWCGGACGLNQHLFKVTSNACDKWLYYLWTAHHLDRFIAIAQDKRTTMGHIKRDDLAKAEVLIPSDEDSKEIGALLNPMLDLIIASRVESRRLAAMRDTLLPRLMSGAIDVSQVRV